MRDKDLYSQILGIQSPWEVTEVDLLVSSGEVKATLNNSLAHN